MSSVISKLLFFLDKNDLRTIYLLFGLFTFVGIVEVIGVVSIMPFIGMITKPDYFGNNQYAVMIKNYLEFNNESLTILAGIVFILIFISCSFLNALMLWKTTNLNVLIGKKISSNLFNHYLNQSYTFFSQTDISAISKNLLQVSVSLSESIVIPILQIISRLIILTLVSILLISVNTEAFIFSIIILTLVYFLIFKKIKNKLHLYGTERLVSNDLLFKNTNDCFKSIKDVKFYKAEKYYQDIFSSSQSKFLSLTAKQVILSTIPRYLIEIIVFGGIFSLVIYLLYIKVDLTQHTPTIALFILAAYRLLPSAQQIFRCSSVVKFNLPALDLIYNDMKLKSDNNLKPTIREQSDDILFKNVSFSYNSEDKIFDNINLSIKTSSINAIVGATGIGKTTLIDLLLGFYKPLTGTISLSTRIFDSNLDAYLIGYVSQNVSYVNDSILKNIAFGIKDNNINLERINKITNQVLLNDHINSLSEGISSKIGDNGIKFSGGQLQRIGIARALYREPKILILDEATNALDIETENKLFQSLKKHYPAMTIICITHRLSTINHCNEIFYLTKNKIENLSFLDSKEREGHIRELITKVKKHD